MHGAFFMSQRTKKAKRSRGRSSKKQLEAALARAIREIGALLETSADPADLRHASRVLRSMAYIATLRANAYQDRIAGSVAKATQHERSIDRLYTELPAEVQW
jgi:hypothetical protein